MKNLFSECLHKELNKKCGIYKISCKKHFYIGSSVNIYYRLKRHMSDLLNNKHANRYIQNIFNKYGKNTFNFEIIEECDKKVLIVRETYYINKMNPNLNFILNPVENIHSKETLLKISNTLKQGYNSKRIKNPMSKLVYQYNIDGNYINFYESCAEAEKVLNLPKGKVSKIASGKGFSCGDYRWSYKKVNKLSLSTISYKGNKKVYVFDINNSLVKVCFSVNDAALFAKVNHRTMSARIKKGNYYNNLKYTFYPGPG